LTGFIFVIQISCAITRNSTTRIHFSAATTAYTNVFLYKNPGNFVWLPYQNCPFEGPEPKADIYIYIHFFKSGAKVKVKSKISNIWV
jgi:hypothetical protein